MRLIDADLLKENISRLLKPSKPDETEMIEVADALVSTMMEVDEQPTAFDVDKVVEQLEEERENVGFVKATTESSAYIRGINDAIKIVKGGGVE